MKQLVYKLNCFSPNLCVAYNVDHFPTTSVMYNIFTGRPLETNWPSSREPNFFRNVDYSGVREAFLAKGWKMRLGTLQFGETILHWDSMDGDTKNWRSLAPATLDTMKHCKQKAVAWLAIFASEADDNNIR
jgi:hypothetical protein